MRGIGLGAVLIALLSSCDPDAARAVEFCSVFCECESPPGLTEDQCLVECTSELAGQIQQLSDACLACITENRDRCLSIEAVCEDACEFDGPQPEPDPSDPPVLVDAGMPDAF